jgi:hypothetical protein
MEETRNFLFDTIDELIYLVRSSGANRYEYRDLLSYLLEVFQNTFYSDSHSEEVSFQDFTENLADIAYNLEMPMELFNIILNQMETIYHAKEIIEDQKADFITDMQDTFYVELFKLKSLLKQFTSRKFQGQHENFASLSFMIRFVSITHKD